MPLLVFTLILLSILLLFINKISNKYLESFRSDISCKKLKCIQATCDKKKIYDILFTIWKQKYLKLSTML